MKWKVTYKIGKHGGGRELCFYAPDFLSASHAVRGILALMDADGLEGSEASPSLDPVTILGVVLA